MLEILAPAGNEACGKIALNNGANAIYLGYSDFSARKNAENFDIDGLKNMITYAHILDAKVYVTMNTIVKDSEVETFIKTLLCIWNVGADAIILQDALLGKYIHKEYPQIVLHLSTQAGVCNEEGALFAKSCGFSRVILARETPLNEIKKITKIIETEAFIQGALCTCFSGQCYFSSFVGGNSGNRGRCKQPCRKLYSYDRIGMEDKSYALSLADLSVGEEIEKYIQAGVVSFKIEGRMRRPEYVGSSVKYYRAILDNVSDKIIAQSFSDLKRTYNRGNYTKGLAFGQDKKFISSMTQGHIGEKIGVVQVINGKYFVQSFFKPSSGDAFKILREGKEVGGAFFEKSKLKGFYLSTKMRLKNGDGVFITTDTALNTRVCEAKKLGRIKISLNFNEGQFAKVEGAGICLQSSHPLQTATGRALTIEELTACFQKTDQLPLEVTFENITLIGNIFIAKSQLNALRRAFFEAYIQSLTTGRNTYYTYKNIALPKFSGLQQKTAVIVENGANVTADIVILKPKDYRLGLDTDFLAGNTEKYIYYPAYLTSEDLACIEKTLPKVDGVYIENYGGFTFAKKHNKKVFVGAGLNIINRVALNMLHLEDNVCYYAISKEANEKEGVLLASDKAFVFSSGNIKLMDLCYCPFGKSCKICDKKDVYTLKDEDNRTFKVRRYVVNGESCRFEVYNTADLIGNGLKGFGYLLDLTLQTNADDCIKAKQDVEMQKQIYQNYTSGHFKRGVL